MPSREALIRETLLTDNLTIEPPMDRETRKVLTAIHDGKDERLAYAMRELSITATSTETTMTADAWHTLIAASRCVLLELEKAGKPIPEANLTANLAQRGFTPADIRDGVNLLRGEKVVARRDGVITDLTGAGGRTKRRLSRASLAPRNSAAPSASTGTTSARPKMPVGNLIEHPDKLDMGERLRAQAAQMPSASFEVGDTSTAPAKPITNKPAPVAIPDSAVVAYIDAILDAFSRVGKPTATWGELGVKRPNLGDLPEGITSAMVADAAIAKMNESGEIRASKSSRTFTYIPAEKAVAALTKWLSDAALPGKTITVAALAADAQKLTPSGWAAEAIAQLVLDAVTESGVIERVDGGYMKPAPIPEPVAPAPAPKPEVVAPERKPAGDTTSDAPDPKPEGNKTEKSETPPAVSIPVLEKKVDVLTVAVGRVEQKLHTLPAPPTKEREMYTDATPEARHVLEKVLVQLKLKSAAPDESDRYMNREALKLRVPGRARVTATNPNPPDLRQHLDAALELGRAMGVISYTEKRGYLFVTHVNVMPKGELDRRVQRVLDIRASREKKKSAA